MQLQMPYGVRADFDVPATMRDGTVLRANVFRPDDGGANTYPVLLTRLPYGKDLPLGSAAMNPAHVARRGYIVVVQDVRGCFTSEGEWSPFLHEGADGADTVAWAASLPGANGVVGMYGLSYFGFTQWAAVRDGAPAVRAMVPMISWDTPDDGPITRNGVLELGTMASWSMLSVGLDKLVRRHQGDPQALGAVVYRMAQEFDALPTGGYAELPMRDFGPLARLGLAESINAPAERRGDAELGAPLDITAAYARVDIPMLHVGGWYDVFLNGTIKNFQGMLAAGHEHQHLLIGPWTHGRFDQVIGDVNYGFASSGSLLDLQVDLISLQLQFFDRWLKGTPTAIDRWPAVKYFVLGANVWKSSETWPPAGMREERWYLHSGGFANTASGDGRLSVDLPAIEPADRFQYDPAVPVPTVGGATLMHPVYRAGPLDQRTVEMRGDVLVYTSEPLAEPLEVAGPVSVTLYVASDAPDTDFVARLVDVQPDGTAHPLTDGVTRMRYREGIHEHMPPLVPGQVYEITIDLWATANIFLPGHRLRLDVTSSNFPRWERNLNTGGPTGVETEMRVARQTILHDDEHRSYIRLPRITS